MLIEDNKIYLDCTYQCNMKCKFCVSKYTGKSDFEIEQFPEIKKDTIVSISGGEPLLYNKLNDLVKHLKHNASDIILCTNGSLLNKNKIEQLVRNGVSYFLIPFYTTSKQFHEYITGSKTFDSIVSNLKNISQNKHQSKLILKILLINQPFSNLESISSFFKINNINPDLILISGLHIKGNLLNHMEVLPSPEEIQTQLNFLINTLTVSGYRVQIQDLPLCYMSDSNIQRYLEYGTLETYFHIEYTKIYLNGVRKFGSNFATYDECQNCSLSTVCNSFFYENSEYLTQYIDKLQSISIE